MKRLLSAVALLAFAATGSLAADNPKAIYFSLQLSSGTADLAPVNGVPTNGYVSAYDHSEYGFKLEYWNMMASDYALSASGGIGMFGEEDKPGTGAAPNSPTQKYSQSSWNLRIGGDRLVKVGERAILFFGPGIEYWSGKAKFENILTDPNVETESVTRISLHGRIGAHMMVADNWGVTIQAGQKVGMATYEEAGAKASWWPSSTDGSMGLVFKFGAVE